MHFDVYKNETPNYLKHKSCLAKELRFENCVPIIQKSATKPAKSDYYGVWEIFKGTSLLRIPLSWYVRETLKEPAFSKSDYHDVWEILKEPSFSKSDYHGVWENLKETAVLKRVLSKKASLSPTGLSI